MDSMRWEYLGSSVPAASPFEILCMRYVKGEGFDGPCGAPHPRPLWEATAHGTYVRPGFRVHSLPLSRLDFFFLTARVALGAAFMNQKLVSKPCIDRKSP